LVFSHNLKIPVLYLLLIKKNEGGTKLDIDLKDRKILYQLDMNCRQSNAQIGKKVGLSKEVVNYRIKRMEDEEIIKGYWTNIDSYRFGYQVFRYYLVTQNASSIKKEEMIQQIADYGNTWVTGSIRGNYDIVAVIWVKNIPEFYLFWDKFNEKFGDYLSDKIFSVYLQADVFPLSFLLYNDYPKSDRENPQHTGTNNPIDITEEDKLLLRELSKNARIPLIEISKKLKCSSQAVNYRLKQLVSKEVIQGFHLGLDIGKLGFEHYKLDLWLKELSKRKKIWNYIKKCPNVTFINTSAGYADLEIEFNIENLDRLHNYIDELQNIFKNSIRKFTYFRGGSPGQLKIRSFPGAD
jgi:Lrp/AsnC family leucine-responsive transcriptional regulator